MHFNRNREYKEALRQQRNQDSHAIYRPKEAATKTDTSPVSNQESPSNQVPSIKSNTSTPTSAHAQNSSNSTIGSTSSPLSPRFQHNSSIKHVGPTQTNTMNSATASNGSTESISSTISNVSSNVSNGTTSITSKSPLRNDKPIQKVTPSRNSTPIKYHHQVTSPTNGNVSIGNKLNSTTTKEYNAYIKPKSPIAKPNTICSNGSPITNSNNTPKTNGCTKTGTKSPRYFWNFKWFFNHLNVILILYSFQKRILESR